MPQARVLSSKELRRVLDHISTRPHAARNRAMLLLTHWAAMRIGEVAALRVGDVLGKDGNVKGEIRLDAGRTKGKNARTVYISDRLRKELVAYVKQLPGVVQHDTPLFPTQKRTAFSGNSLCQHVNLIYARVGMDGATSHSGRRSLITSLAQKGVGVRVLAAIAGHRDIRVTQAYIDVNDAMMRSAIELAG
jgi:integrase/recombinase XerD